MRYAALLVGLLAVAAVVSGVAGAAPPPEMEGPTTEFHVHLQQDGDARWEVRMQFDLDSENETQAFQQYANRFESGETTVGPDVTFFESAAGTASKAANREMEVTNVSRTSTVLEEGDGVLRLQFVWTNFLEGGGDQYVLHDALMTEDGGTWLRSLEEGQTLRIYHPPGYGIDESSRARQVNQSLIVDGPTTYESEEFRVVYGQRQGGGTPISPIGPGETNFGAVALGAALLVGLAVLGVWLYQRRTESDEDPDDGRPGRPDDGDTPGPTVAEPVDDPAANGDGVGDAPAASIDPELLSDEERVERLLKHNGGRMRQADIVTETDWSDAKVSQLLSRMADDGRVEKLRLGRENLITLPGADARNGQGQEN